MKFANQPLQHGACRFAVTNFQAVYDGQMRIAEGDQLIFPDLGAANIAYKMMTRIGGAESLGPILMGLSKSVHVLQRGATVEEIDNMAAIAVVDAQKHSVQLQVAPRLPAA